MYHTLTYILLPFLVLFWFAKSLLNKSYLDRLTQRFGFGYPKLKSGSIWIHAVSVGEVQASIPLVNELKQHYPYKEIIITTVTPTGSKQVKNIFKDAVETSYIPFETNFAIKNFFNSIKPSVALIMETEIWPNLYKECGSRGIPLILVSARISEKSLINYKRFLPLFRDTLSHGILIAAQSQIDADRFLALGASKDRTWIMGNIKFDFKLPEEILTKAKIYRSKIFPRRHIWIAASTHEHEEEIILEAHKNISKKIENLLLILVPRHPERFAKITQILKENNWIYSKKSDDQDIPESCQVLLIDTIGELLFFYACSDVAFVGGSLLPVGGHNLLEPAAIGLPIITGAHTFNQKEMTDRLTQVDALRIVHNANSLSSDVIFFLTNTEESKNAGQRGKLIVESNKGAIKSLMKRLYIIIGEETQ
jgi:3-deoxy-D-manno-octulosonic-acid transferase